MAVRYADVVLDYFNSGRGTFDEPYGGTYNESTQVGSFPRPVSLGVVLGGDKPTVDFLSLPTESYVTVGFRDEAIVNRKGVDIRIEEIASNDERADIYVSSNGQTFTKLGTAQGGVTASFDLSDIGWQGVVTAIKIVGLNNGGGSPGYDVVGVSALNLQRLSKPNELDGTNDSDDFKGGGGADKISGKRGADTLSGQGGGDSIKGGNGRDALGGGKGGDTLDGGRGRDSLGGGKGRDTLDGDKGRDTLDGGTGLDTLEGGRGADSFTFSAAPRKVKKNTDIILDFKRGQGDVIDVSGIDADKDAAGDQQFDFIKKKKFSGDGAELRFTKKEGDTFVYGDTDGDAKAEFAFRIDDAISLKQGDFML